MLEELVRKYEEHRDKKHVNDLKLQSVYDIRVCYAQSKHLDMMNSTERADVDLGSVGNGGHYHDDGGQEGDSSRDGAEGKTRKGTVQWILLPMWTVVTHGKGL